MHKFIERYADSIKDSDAVKLILHEVKEAYKECENEDKNYIEHLEKAEEMIKFYKELKGY